MIVAGLGCQKGVPAERIVAAIQRALSHHGATQAELGLLLTGVIKSEEPGIREAAAQLGLPLMIVDDARLQSAAGRCLTTSQASMDATGLPSLSEAAAIVGAASGGRLLGPRIVLDVATCALAETAGAHQ